MTGLIERPTPAKFRVDFSGFYGEFVARHWAVSVMVRDGRRVVWEGKMVGGRRLGNDFADEAPTQPLAIIKASDSIHFSGFWKKFKKIERFPKFFAPGVDRRSWLPPSLSAPLGILV